MKCKGSGSKVSKAARKGAVYTADRGWRGWCPHGQHAAGWERTNESDKRTGGYVYRYADHEESKP